MSPLRTERLTIALCPDRIGVVRSSGLWRRRMTAQLEIEVTQSATGTAWSGVLETLEHWLADNDVRNIRADLVFSSRFMRHTVVPWSDNVKTLDEEAALARARFESQYGDMADWTIRLDTGVYGRARIASAIETPLLDGLKRTFAHRAPRCRTASGYFELCWNRWRHNVLQGDALFLLAESGTALIAAIKGGQWLGIRELRTPADASLLETLLEREALLQGYAELPGSFVHVPGLAAHEYQESSAVWNWLNPEVLGNSAALTMACAGATP